MTLYRLERRSALSHATLNDLYHERTKAENCSASLIHDIARSLNMKMDQLYAMLTYDDLSLIAYDESLDLFRSSVCHELKDLGYKEFLKKHLKQDTVRELSANNQNAKALYLLSIIDHLCVSHKIPFVKEYDAIRSQKLTKLYVPKSIYLQLTNKMIRISDVYRDSISSFLDHNIAEDNIYDVQ